MYRAFMPFGAQTVSFKRGSRLPHSAFFAPVLPCGAGLTLTAASFFSVWDVVILWRYVDYRDSFDALVTSPRSARSPLAFSRGARTCPCGAIPFILGVILPSSSPACCHVLALWTSWSCVGGVSCRAVVSVDGQFGVRPPWRMPPPLSHAGWSGRLPWARTLPCLSGSGSTKRSSIIWRTQPASSSRSGRIGLFTTRRVPQVVHLTTDT